MLIDRVQSRVKKIDKMKDVIPVSDYLPPHKMPGYVPYDGVVPVIGSDWDCETVADKFDTHSVPYETIVGIEANDTDVDADLVVFVQFRSEHQ